MPTTTKMPRELRDICRGWSKEMETRPGTERRMHFIRSQLPELLSNVPLFVDLVDRIARGGTYPDIRHADAFENEILLYMDPRRLFSLRMFIFGPGEFTPIHDHNAWGIIGSVFNELTVVKHHREDDGSIEGFAKIQETEQLRLMPGDIDSTMPLDQGIHQTGNANQDLMIMVSVYGTPVRRLYVNRYDADKNRVHKMYPPRVKKRLLAKSLLRFIKAPAS